MLPQGRTTLSARCRGIRGDVGIAPYTPPTESVCVTFGRTDPSAPTHAYRTRTLSLSCHSEPVLTLAWESASPRPQARNLQSLPCVKGGVARRATEGLSFRGRGRAPPLHTSADSLCAIRAGGCGHPPLRNHRRRMRHTHGRTEPSRLHTVSRRQNISNQRPKAATYLCRSAAKARFDNRPHPRRVFPKREGRSPPSLVVSRGKDF